MPKRYGYLTQRIVMPANMERAFGEVVDKLPEPRREYYRHRRESFFLSLHVINKINRIEV